MLSCIRLQSCSCGSALSAPADGQPLQGSQQASLRVAFLGRSETAVNRERLADLLEAQGEFPSKYRPLIWEFLLQLPRNSAAYQVPPLPLHRQAKFLEGALTSCHPLLPTPCISWECPSIPWADKNSQITGLGSSVSR